MLLTVRRAGDALDLFRRQSEWGVSAVAAELGIAKSQSHELLSSLCVIGLVRRSGRGRYRLGWGTVSLSHELLRQEFRGHGAVAVRRLALATQQSAHLVALDRSRIVVLAARRGADEECPSAGLEEQTLHCTAAGKLLLAHRSGVAEVGLGGLGLQAFTPDTIVSPQLLEQHLRDIAHRGLATDLGESHADRRAVAAPVLDRAGNLLAALTLTTSIARWRRCEQEYTIVVRREAELLSRELRRRALSEFDERRVA